MVESDSPSATAIPQLEGELQRELGIEGFAGAEARIAEVRSKRGSNLADFAGGGEAHRRHVDVIEDVEHISLELGGNPFSDGGGLDEGDVYGRVPGVVVLAATG